MSTETTTETPTVTETLDRLTADDVLADVRCTARALAQGGMTFDEVVSHCLEVAALSYDAPSAGTVERAVRHAWEAGQARASASAS